MTTIIDQPSRTKPIKQLIVFDFDWSLVDQDTDRYLFEVLDPSLRSLLIQRKHDLQWTDNVADCLDKLSERGFTRQQIDQAFSTLPLHPAMKRAIESLALPTSASSATNLITTQFLILSNSNSVFIETVLKHHNLYEIFRHSIITNPAHWGDEQGVGNPNHIVLRRRVDPNGPQHSCSLGCSPNMCKGAELRAYLEREGGATTFDRIAYIGDGDNDYCPIVQLTKQDYALVRKGRELPRRIAEERQRGNQLSCHVVEWDGAWEVEQIFLNKLSS